MPNLRRVTDRQHGFTLLEVLLALVIFAMLSISAYTVLQGVMRNDEVSQAKIARLSEMQRAFATLTRDFTQITPRPVRLNGETSTTVFQAERLVWKVTTGQRCLSEPVGLIQAVHCAVQNYRESAIACGNKHWSGSLISILMPSQAQRQLPHHCSRMSLPSACDFTKMGNG